MGYKTPREIVVNGAFGASNPAVSTAYYLTLLPTLGMTTSTAYGNFICPSNGTIRNVYVSTYASNAAGTAEAWAMLLRNVTAGTDTTIDSLTVANALREWDNDNINLSVSKGDKLLIKTTTPNWVTPPSNFYGAWWLLFEYE